jgi:hypothetical protein
VVIPTLCETKDKSLSDVYTPGETKTLLDVAIFILNVFEIYLLINIVFLFKN